MADFVAGIVKDPANPPQTTLLTGYVGASSEPGHTRLYFDAGLSSYVEIPDDAILHRQDVDDPSGLGGTHLWVRRDAELIAGPAGSQRPKGKFLEGPIMQAAAAGGAPGVAQPVTLPPACGQQPTLLPGCGTTLLPPCPSHVPCITQHCTLPVQCRSDFVPCQTWICTPVCPPTPIGHCPTHAPLLCPITTHCPTRGPALCPITPQCPIQTGFVCGPVSLECPVQTAMCGGGGPQAGAPVAAAAAALPPRTLPPICHPTPGCHTPFCHTPVCHTPFCTPACPHTPVVPCPPPHTQAADCTSLGPCGDGSIHPHACSAPACLPPGVGAAAAAPVTMPVQACMTPPQTPVLPCPQTQLGCPTHAPFMCPQTQLGCPTHAPFMCPQTQVGCPTHAPFLCPTPPIVCASAHVGCPTHAPFFCRTPVIPCGSAHVGCVTFAPFMCPISALCAVGAG
jgi:hypothetical protein